MKKIALLSDGWKRLIVYAWTDGIMNKINDYKEDICLYHYNCFGNWSSDNLHNKGEYNIYNLPDLKQFDGIFVDCNNIKDKQVLEHLIDLVRESGVPAISIAQDIEGFYYVGIENEKAMGDMMDHIHNVHGCNSFIFAGGPTDNYENTLRTRGYLEVLYRFGLSRADNPVLYGDYDFHTGVEYFKRIVKKGWTLPDAIVCANDNIAAGICSEAEKKGYKVPGDFIVTGFDNLDKAAYFRPQITTVHHDRGHITSRGMDILFDIWDGKTPERYNFLESQCIFGESCGCPNSGLVDYREYMKGQILYGIKKSYEEEKTSELEGRISQCKSFYEIFDCVGDFFEDFDSGGFGVVLYKSLLDVEPSDFFSVDGYNHDEFQVAFLRDKTIEYDIQSVDELFSMIEEKGAGNEYLFTPIHFKEQTVGFSILKNGRFLYDNPYFYDVHNVLVRQLETLYRSIKLSAANSKLRDIYDKDQLTGIYNRIAYVEKMTPAFKKCYEEGVVCTIAFVDVDDFKNINDTYGHDYGDEVLKKVASTLQKKCPDDGYVCRYGGDEFIMFFPNASRELADEVKAAINKEAAEMDVKLSIGMVLTSDDHGSDIENYFEVADKYMYQEKMLHKNQK